MQVVLICLQWFRRNSLLKCVSQPKISKNSLKPLILGVQGRSRSSMLVPSESSSAVLVVICSKSVSIYNRSHTRRVNDGKLMSSFEGNLLTQGREMRSQKTWHPIIWCKPGVSIWPGLESVPGCDRQTDGQTDRHTEITIASTRCHA